MKSKPCLNLSAKTKTICLLAFLSSAITVFAVLDEDNDGMSDVWQRVYNIASFDTLSDPDKDGRNNLEEAQAGTNPNDKNDYFRTINYQIKPEVGTIDLTWRSLEDRSYNIEKSQDLVSWSSLHQMRGILGEQTSISLNIPTFPLNDQFESRLPTSTVAGQTTGNNKDASLQVGEPDQPSAAGRHSVWWSWKATAAGDVTITTNGSDFDTTLAVYTGDTLATLVLIGADDDGGDGRQSAVTFTADPSMVYSLQVNGYNIYTGNITLNHPVSAGTFDQPVASDGKPDEIFFRVNGDRFSDLDRDVDQLVTWEERLIGTDPAKLDTDGDEMSDSFEFTNAFDPNNPADGTLDADGDGINNALEEATGMNPRNPDSDGNGIDDGLEDFDNDTLTNLDELNIHNTDPKNPDTDGDQMPDGWEIEHGLDPNEEDGVDGQDGDSDGDGVTNFAEYLNGTDPHSTDTDGDGTDDGVEISQGSDPAHSADEGKAPKEVLKELSFRVGDPSFSFSENWLMCIRGIGDDPDTRSLKVKGKYFGVMSDPTPFKLRVGKSYEITIQHLGTYSHYEPDYDWEATIDGLPAGIATVIAEGDDVTANEAFIVGDYWIVDNREAVLTTLKEGNDTNLVQGKKAYLRPIEIVPDYNRDGKIDLTDRGRVTISNPWRWWINDDNDKTVDLRGENADDIPIQPEGNRDCNDLKVDGVRDFIDFFPLHLDLKATLDIFPKEDYKFILKHQDEALKYFEHKTAVIDGSEGPTSVKAIDVYTKSLIVARASRDKDLILISEDGVELSEGYLTQAKNGNGVILVEGAKKTNLSLYLEVVKKEDNSSMLQLEFTNSIFDVEFMYRQLNLRSVTGDNSGPSSWTGNPGVYPDSLTNGKYVAYMHGVNVSAESARGSHSNIFKRLHQSGSKARFIGVFWHGTPPAPSEAVAEKTADYHQAVYNAFLTGDAMKDAFSFTEGSSLTMMVHSLGNIATSQALSNEEKMLQVDHYIIIDGAVPIEAYDATQTSNSDNEDMPLRMTENEWKPYYNYGVGTEKGKQQRLFAANWHQLFDTPDNRRKLTWKNLFSHSNVLSNAYNFYSTGEEVLENADDGESFLGNAASIPFIGTSRHAWISQEIAKGGKNGAAHDFFGDINGGWEFHYHDQEDVVIIDPWEQGYAKPDMIGGIAQDGYRRYTPQEAADEITDEQLRLKPFYRPFLYRDLYDPAQGSTIAGDDHKRYKLLSSGIPSMSYAIGANSIPKLEDFATLEFKRNYNIHAEFKAANGETNWPELDAEHTEDWGHSDFKDVSFQYVFPMYDKIIEIGKLKEN